MGEVTGPPSRRLRIGVLGEIPGVAGIDAPTRSTLDWTAELLADLGHHVEPTTVPVEPEQFREDFIFYYRFLVFMATNTARIVHGPHYDKLRGSRRSPRAWRRRFAPSPPGSWPCHAGSAGSAP
ncbi:MAG: hypothetical protein M5U19_07595 [Microthrixaceae bacterium]|nr:hypothetical protein [Microthrixaceae bacterium]